MNGIRRCHPMPFGAELQESGRVRFALWAPAAEQVELLLPDRDPPAYHAMRSEEDGWFRLITTAAGAGSRYRFRIDGDREVPDPASRYQPEGVHGPSEVIDPGSWPWRDGEWRGRAWEKTVLYELHTGTFTPEGTLRAAQQRLPHLAELGITAVELMPVAAFPGRRGWGYDGVDPFAVTTAYGRPDDLKAFVQAAHDHGLMVLLDVVYNHFGPEGNYLHQYAPDFFTRRYRTPWGEAIRFSGTGSRWVREFFLHNALYWLEEYHLDGLRLDAVHAIFDDSRPDILTELAQRVQAGPGAQRPVHLVLENDRNAARYLHTDPPGYRAQWNDDFHHALHVQLSGETHGYYRDYADDPTSHLLRCLTGGFAYQGESSAYREGQPRGEPSAHLPASAFVAFLQNHDQVGNRALGERITRLTDAQRLRAATALLLQPSPPLLFMGQEWACEQPFLYFCDLGEDLAEAVVEGRRAEFAGFPGFKDEQQRDRIPNPMEVDTFLASRLDWRALDTGHGRDWYGLHRELLSIRHRDIIPRLGGGARPAEGVQLAAGALQVHWRLDGAWLTLLCNLGEGTATALSIPAGQLLYGTHPPPTDVELPPASMFAYLTLGEAAP